MIGHEIFSLDKLIKSSIDISEHLSDFRCARNEDVQMFIKKRAVEFEKRHLSRTYLIVNAESKKTVAYFSIAISSVDAKNIDCSGTLKKKLNIGEDGIMQSYLIGQIGRDDRTEKGFGKKVLDEAIDMIKEINLRIGCRVIRLDCKDEQNLVEYYTDNGFKKIRKNELVQMVKVI